MKPKGQNVTRLPVGALSTLKSMAIDRSRNSLTPTVDLHGGR